MRPVASSVPKMPTATSTIVASDRPQQHDPAAHAGVLCAMGTDPARIRGKVVEAIPREGRFRHLTMVPVPGGGHVRAVRGRTQASAGCAGGAGDPRLLARIADAAQPLDEHRIVLLRVGGVDQTTEQLVVPCRARARGRRGSPPPSRPRAGAIPPRIRGWRGRGRSRARGHANAASVAAAARATPRTRRAGPPRRAERRRGRGRSLPTSRDRPAAATSTCKPGRVDRDPHGVQLARWSRSGARGPARGMCGSTPGVVTTSVASRGASAASSASTSGSVASPRTRIGGSAAAMSSAASIRAARPSSPGHTRLSEEAAVVGIRGIERSEVDARAPHDVRHPQRRIAGDRRTAGRPSTGPPAGSRSRSAAVAVRVAVGVEAQTGARADLEQRDRPVDAAQRGQQRRAPQRLVRLQAAARSTRRRPHRRAPRPTPPTSRYGPSGAPSMRVTANTSGGWRCVAGMRAEDRASSRDRAATPAAHSAYSVRSPGASSRAKRP